MRVKLEVISGLVYGYFDVESIMDEAETLYFAVPSRNKASVNATQILPSVTAIKKLAFTFNGKMSGKHRVYELDLE